MTPAKVKSADPHRRRVTYDLYNRRMEAIRTLGLILIGLLALRISLVRSCFFGVLVARRRFRDYSKSSIITRPGFPFCF